MLREKHNIRILSTCVFFLLSRPSSGTERTQTWNFDSTLHMAIRSLNNDATPNPYPLSPAASIRHDRSRYPS